MVKRSIIVFLFIGILFQMKGQEDQVRNEGDTFQILLEAGLIGAIDDELPLWMKSNNAGRYGDRNANGYFQRIHVQQSAKVIPQLELSWEIETMLSQSMNGVYGSLIQGNLKAQTAFLVLRAGLDEEFFGFHDRDLSVGNLSYSNNARPIPKISLSTNGWKRSPVLGKYLSYKAYIAQGWFEDERFQSAAMLHQKYLYLKLKLLNEKLSISGGLHHNAQWGGYNATSEIKQPVGLKNYFRIFRASSGGNDASSSDQNNALGNHLGNYDIEFKYQFNGFSVSNHWQFLWEDSSGLNPLNWRDGLIGLTLEFDQSNWFRKFIIERISTTNQDAYKVGKDGVPFVEPDNFMNNGVYRSGWSYQQVVMGSPMFLILNREAQNGRQIKNMVTGWNIGVSGGKGGFDYQMKLTKFQNAGLIQEVFDPVINVLSVDLKANYVLNNGLLAGVWLNYQEDNYDQGQNLGFMLSLTKIIDLKD